MFKVFISSTYADLKDYRRTVIEQLNRMKVDGVKMEFFGATDADPTTTSLKQLETCNVYIGIIGHRFGSPSPDGDRSITQSEYDKAVELYERGRVRLLLYLADDEVKLGPNLREPDALFTKQQEFRNSLKKHTIRYFQTPYELAAWVSADLYSLREQGGYREIETLKIFNPDDWPVIKDKFDSLSDDRLARIQKFLEFLARSFANLFHFDSKRMDVHPFFKEVREQLRSIIPGVSLDDEGGILKRTGVRHVILRTETAQLLIRSLQELKEEKLFEVGERIGTGAVTDLISNTVEAKQLIPASAEAFVTLWDYWDRTGGWGKLSLVKEFEIDGSDQAPQQASSSEWRIKIENNFLATSDLDETHRLSNFWCGYIYGVLNEALPRIKEIMTNKLDRKQRQKVTLPAYHRVVQVTHEPDISLTSDIFCVRFEVLPFSLARRALSNCQSQIKDGEYENAMESCRYALLLAQAELGPRFDEVFNNMRMEMQTGKAIRQMLDNSLITPDEAMANRWFNAANFFIQEISV